MLDKDGINGIDSREHFGVVYVIRNLENNLCYIGQTTKTLRERFNRHKNRETNTLIHKAIQTYGEGKFSIEAIDTGKSREELLEKEVYWIAKLETKAPLGYNSTEGGEGVSGYKFTEEQRNKLSESHKGYVMPKEQRDKIAEGNRKPKTEEHAKNISKGLKEYYKQNPVSEERKQRLSQAMKGKRHTEETKAKLSKIRRGRKLSDEEYKKYRERVDAKLKKVRNIDTGEIFNNINEAGETFDNPEQAKKGIRRVCSGGRKTYKGCRWEYIDE